MILAMSKRWSGNHGVCLYLAFDSFLDEDGTWAVIWW